MGHQALRLLIGPYVLGDGKVGEQINDLLLSLKYPGKDKWYIARAEHFSLNGLKTLSSWRGPDKDASNTESLSSKLVEVMHHDQYDLPEIAQLEEDIGGGDEATRAEANTELLRD